jgi:hypothetical protein
MMARTDMERGRVYSREYARRWRADPANREKYRAAQRRSYARQAGWKKDRRAELLAFIQWLKAVPCADCGGSFPPVAMDFDHRDPAAKRANVSAMLAGYSFESVVAEVLKCEVVCANCHRVRSAA